MGRAKRHAPSDDAAKLATLVLQIAAEAPRCRWGYDEDEDDSSEQCPKIGTHQVEGPHDMDCGEYCKAHATKVRDEQCNPPSRFMINPRPDRVLLARAATLARRLSRGG